jgi:DNA-directed RNA polymerase subunit L
MSTSAEKVMEGSNNNSSSSGSAGNGSTTSHSTPLTKSIAARGTRSAASAILTVPTATRPAPKKPTLRMTIPISRKLAPIFELSISAKLPSTTIITLPEHYTTRYTLMDKMAAYDADIYTYEKPDAVGAIPNSHPELTSKWQVLKLPSQWQRGWRVEEICDAVECEALSQIHNLPLNQAFILRNGVKLTPFIVNLLKKLYKEATNAAITADKNSDTLNTQSQVYKNNLTLCEDIQTKDENTSKKIKQALTCPICSEVATLPKVLGSCGHTACQACLKKLDEVAFFTLTATNKNVSARQHLLARRCPSCRHEMIGMGFPVLKLKDTAIALIEEDYTSIKGMSSIPKNVEELRTISYEIPHPMGNRITTLQTACYAQSKLAEDSVGQVIPEITKEQWETGVSIMVESAVSQVFFETFATTLQGKAGGVNVFANAKEGMLTAQLVKPKPEPKDPTPQIKPEPKDPTPHLLIKIIPDGRFTITLAVPTTAATTTPASGSAATSVAASVPTVMPASPVVPAAAPVPIIKALRVHPNPIVRMYQASCSTFKGQEFVVDTEFLTAGPVSLVSRPNKEILNKTILVLPVRYTTRYTLMDKMAKFDVDIDSNKTLNPSTPQGRSVNSLRWVPFQIACLSLGLSKQGLSLNELIERRIKNICDATELEALRQINALQGTHSKPLVLPHGVSLDPFVINLLKKLYNGFTHAVKSADRDATILNAAFQKYRHNMRMYTENRTNNLRIFKKIKEILVCCVCSEVTATLMVLGQCGDTICQKCLTNLNKVSDSNILNLPDNERSGRRHLTGRRCPVCPELIMGKGFPVIPIKEIVTALFENNCIDTSKVGFTPNASEANIQMAYEKQTSEGEYLATLQMQALVQLQLAQYSVKEVINKITAEQWKHGVYIWFENAVSRIFFEIFATTLQGKAGGVNVLINAARRMLAVQLVYTTKQPSTPNKSLKPKEHLLVKVAADGNFTITTTVEPTKSDAPAAGSVATGSAPAGGAAPTTAVIPATTIAASTAPAVAVSATTRPAASTPPTVDPVRRMRPTNGTQAASNAVINITPAYHLASGSGGSGTATTAATTVSAATTTVSTAATTVSVMKNSDQTLSKGNAPSAVATGSSGNTTVTATTASARAFIASAGAITVSVINGPDHDLPTDHAPLRVSKRKNP